MRLFRAVSSDRFRFHRSINHQLQAGHDKSLADWFRWSATRTPTGVISFSLRLITPNRSIRYFIFIFIPLLGIKMPSIQSISLAALCLHYSSLSILMHLSRTGQQNSNYRASSAVVMTELFKFMISLLMAINQSSAQFTPHYSRSSPHSRFEPQFESLPEEDSTDRIDRLESENRDRSETDLNPPIDPSRPKWDEESDQLITDVIDQIQSNSSRMRQRTVSSDLYPSNHAGKRRRLISSNGSLASPDKPIRTRTTSDHSHSYRMSVQSSPQLVHPSQPNPRSRFTYRLHQIFEHLYHSIFSQDWILLGIPAVMFVVQNNLQYLAASNLSVPIFQITYQLKILTTALCSVILLKRSLRRTQWASLILLTVGVIIVQLNSQETKLGKKSMDEKLERETGFHTLPDRPQEANPSLGLAAVILACLSSGFASVYLERMLKSSDPKTNLKGCSVEYPKRRLSENPTDTSFQTGKSTIAPSKSIWIRNMQLSSFGLMISIFIVLIENWIRNSGSMSSGSSIGLKDHHHPSLKTPQIEPNPMTFFFINREEFFQGFSNLTWIVIFFQVTGGLLNSVVMKYSNNINKNFSICVSIILSIVISHVLPIDSHSNLTEDHLNLEFFVGASFVIFSTWLFNV